MSKEIPNHPLFALARQLPEWGLLTDYKLSGEILGSGSSSLVLAAEEKETHARYALKISRATRDAPLTDSDHFREAVCLQAQAAEKSPYIVRILFTQEIWITENPDRTICAISDQKTEESSLVRLVLMEHLLPVIRRKGNQVVFARSELTGPEEKMKLASEIGQALLTVHQLGGLHRDVKLENIFWSEVLGVYQLGDFGAAKQTIDGNADTIVFSDGYGAPEVLRTSHARYGRSADIYSFGITLYLIWNRFCFPGSARYSYSPVQYDPDFMFPAPADAPEGLPKILRTMCSFRRSDRYQQMEEVLYAFSCLQKQDETEQETTEPDMDTVKALEPEETDDDMLLFRTARNRDLKARTQRHIRDVSALTVILSTAMSVWLLRLPEAEAMINPVSLWVLAVLVPGYGLFRSWLPWRRLVLGVALLIGFFLTGLLLYAEHIAGITPAPWPFPPGILVFAVLTGSSAVMVSFSASALIRGVICLLQIQPFGTWSGSLEVQIAVFAVIGILVIPAVYEEQKYRRDIRYIREKKYEQNGLS